MSTFSEILAQIADDADRFDELKALGRESHNIEIDGVYCLHTGRLIGRVDREEIGFAIEEEAYDSDDDLVDALVVRAVASMRPSPALNKPDRITIANLCAKRPADGMAFLLNRLYGNRATTRERNEHSIQFFFERIHTNRQVVSLQDSGFALAPWIHWLLELDTKLNLHDVTPPLFEQDRLGKWIITVTGKPLIEALTVGGAALLPVFESWVFKLLDSFEKGQHAAQMQAAWNRGNTMAGPAFIRSWLENPEAVNRKESALNKARIARDAAKARKASKPVSEKSRIKNERMARAMSILDSIESVINSSASKPTPKPAAKPVFKAGQLFRKKES